MRRHCLLVIGFLPTWAVSFNHLFKALLRAFYVLTRAYYVTKGHQLHTNRASSMYKLGSWYWGKYILEVRDALNNVPNKYVIKIMLNIMNKESQFNSVHCAVYVPVTSQWKPPPWFKSLTNFSQSCLSQQRGATFFSC